MKFTSHPFEIEQYVMDEKNDLEEPLVMFLDSKAELDLFLSVLPTLGNDNFYVFSLQENNNGYTLSFLSRSGVMLYYKLGYMGAVKGI